MTGQSEGELKNGLFLRFFYDINIIGGALLLVYEDERTKIIDIILIITNILYVLYLNTTLNLENCIRVFAPVMINAC